MAADFRQNWKAKEAVPFFFISVSTKAPVTLFSGPGEGEGGGALCLLRLLSSVADSCSWCLPAPRRAGRQQLRAEV